ncbi:MAG TPA: hypothetical protein VGG72_07380 [Bryobacteraceae bacterium]
MTSPKYGPKSADDRVYFPRGGSLDLQFQVSPGTQEAQDPAAVIEALLTEYHARGYPAKYTMERRAGEPGWFYVLPDQLADRRGVFGKAEPVTKARVSVVVRQGENLYSVMNEVLKELSSISGERVGLGAILFT